MSKVQVHKDDPGCLDETAVTALVPRLDGSLPYNLYTAVDNILTCVALTCTSWGPSCSSSCGLGCSCSSRCSGPRGGRGRVSASSRDAGCCGPAYACITAQITSERTSSTSQPTRQIPTTMAGSCCSGVTLQLFSLQVPHHVYEVSLAAVEMTQSSLQSGDCIRALEHSAITNRHMLPETLTVQNEILKALTCWGMGGAEGAGGGAACCGAWGGP